MPSAAPSSISRMWANSCRIRLRPGLRPWTVSIKSSHETTATPSFHASPSRTCIPFEVGPAADRLDRLGHIG